jgi:hypothetical protein
MGGMSFEVGTYRSGQEFTAAGNRDAKLKGFWPQEEGKNVSGDGG